MVSNRRTAWKAGTQRANGCSAAGVEPDSKVSQSCSCKQPSLHVERGSCVRNGREADRDRRFLERLADRGDHRGIGADLGRKRAVGGVDPASGNTSAPAANAMPSGALDHQQLGQQLGRAVDAVPHQDQSRCGDCVVSHSGTGRRGLHAADVLLLGVGRVGRVVDRSGGILVIDDIDRRAARWRHRSPLRWRGR